MITRAKKRQNSSTLSGEIEHKRPKDNQDSDDETDDEVSIEENNYATAIFDDAAIQEIFTTKLKTDTEKDLLYAEYLKCKKIIEEREITVVDILTSNMQYDKKADLIEMYNGLKLCTPYTEEYIINRTLMRIKFEKFSDLKKSEKPVIIESSDDKKFRAKLKTLDISKDNYLALEKKIDELEDCNFKGNDEKSKLKRWLNTALSLPFDAVVPPPSDVCRKLKEVKDYLDQNLYGMNKVKERLMLFLNKKLTLGDCKGCCLALIGKSGCGKTFLIKALSKCLGIPFAQISCGGMNGSDFLLGHDYCYTGSREGEIARCLLKNKVKNGIFFFDEFEKVSNKKDILSTLLHVTDFAQNNEFKDSYFSDLTQDLSKTWFIFSMNALPEDTAMVDRLEVINVDSYTPEERRIITKDYTIPKLCKEIGLDATKMDFPKETIERIVSHSKGDGVRNIERNVNLILEKIFFYVKNKILDYDYNWFKYLKNFKAPNLTVSVELVDLILSNQGKEDIYHHMYL